MLKFKKLILPLLVLSVATISFVLASSKKAPTPYLYTPAKIQDIVNTIEASGSLKAIKTVNVGAQANGQIKKLNAKIGAFIKENDILVQIDSTNQENSLKDAQAQIKKYTSEIDSKKIALEIAQEKLKASEQAVLAGGLSKSSFLDAKLNAAQANSELAAAQASLTQARITEQKALQELKYVTVKAPISGIITAVPVSEGQTVISAQSSPTLVTIADVSKMVVKAEIAEADVQALPKGAEAQFSLIGSTTKRTASVMSIDPAPLNVSDNTTSSSTTAVYYYADIVTDNLDNTLKIGMTAKITIPKSISTQVLTVPLSAVFEENGKTYLLKKSQTQEAEKISVKTGVKNATLIQIVSGIKEGDLIVYAKGTAEKSSSGPKGPGGPF